MTQLYDASSRANYQAWTTTHTTLDVVLDFEQRVLQGLCVLELQQLTAAATEIVLDTSHLDIAEVRINETPAAFHVAPRKEPFGSPLHITLPGETASHATVTVTIRYKTTTACTALQWLSPAQTSGLKPYMFSQCQAIHARSMFPCQDTPLVKGAYTYIVASPYPIVASGLYQGRRRSDTSHVFHQSVPIPSYLVALASGDLASAQIGPRSTLYTEPKYLYDAQQEMAPVMESFLLTAESFLPAYAWTTYDVLVLPQSFPYGGMENPNMTFATPTILAGDGSNLDVIAHELAHSWNGNLVTCAGWQHFAINEGGCVWVERKIIEKQKGKKYADFSAIIGWNALEESVRGYGETHEFTKLIPNLDGVDPDDSFSSVPYEKGYNLFRYLEELLGSASFEKFFHHYYVKFAGKSITWFQLKDTLYEFYEDKRAILDKVDWQDKFYSPGLPPRPAFDTTVAIPCYNLAKRWIDAKTAVDAGFSLDDVRDWEAGQVQVFLDTLANSAFKSPEALVQLGTIYQFQKSRNAEILFRYFNLGLAVHAKPLYDDVAKFLATVGRMKFVRPLFRGLHKVDQALAKKTFEQVGPGLHPICRDLVRKDLALKKN